MDRAEKLVLAALLFAWWVRRKGETIVPTTDPDAFLRANGIDHFSWAELTRRATPPLEWLPRIVPALRIAEEIRAVLGVPLRATAYRTPEGDAGDPHAAHHSQHHDFRAVDLDLLGIDATPGRQRAFYEAAAGIFSRDGQRLKMGLGFYSSGDRPAGSRVHVDCGGRSTPTAWGPTNDRDVAVSRVLSQLGLPFPGRSDAPRA